jgi:hypothetical protein
VPDFGRVFLMLKYADITQNTYVQSCISIIDVIVLTVQTKMGRNITIAAMEY